MYYTVVVLMKVGFYIGLGLAELNLIRLENRRNI